MKGKTVHLRILEREDIVQTQKWISDPIIADIMGYLPVFSLLHQNDYYDKIYKSNTTFVFCIIDNASNKHIGNVGIGNIDYISRHGMFNIFIGTESNRQKGSGSEATMLALNFAFNTLNLNKIWLKSSSRFHQAIKMYEKIGFIKEGVLRNHYFTNGNYEDKIIYSILKSEFKIDNYEK
jgi:RimJ/RimL family protein N-acetyltransferase